MTFVKKGSGLSLLHFAQQVAQEKRRFQRRDYLNDFLIISIEEEAEDNTIVSLDIARGYDDNDIFRRLIQHTRMKVKDDPLLLSCVEKVVRNTKLSSDEIIRDVMYCAHFHADVHTANVNYSYEKFRNPKEKIRIEARGV